MGIISEQPLGKPKPIPSIRTFFTQTSPFLMEELKRFWKTEEITVSISPNPEDAFCEDHFINTCTRDLQGRFVVSLPFRSDKPIDLDSTREIALRRFRNLENRFRKDPEYKYSYAAQMDEYIRLDHVRLTKNPSPYVMTHHGVIKDSSATKLRVVFNGSEKTVGGNSLNDLL